ncbi:MAG TPA: peptide ABC transporter substrate-binding protein [Acidimicrobiia bacterium]|nr:peptide ABC transporter substrate-binding protein [Acidimicrobiia bacterium]
MKKTRLLSLLAVFAMVVAACGGGDVDGTTTTGDGGATTTSVDSTEPTEPPTGGGAGEGGNLLLLQWQAVSQANPYLSTGTKDIQAGSMVLEGLAEYNTDGEIVTALATEVPTVENGGIAEDLTSITWTIQDGVLWSDGTPLTADDFVFTWEYCIDELTGCISPAFESVTSVEAVDDSTVQITFDGPTPWPYVPFVGATEPVLQRAQFADCVGEAATACTEQNFQPVGTGPFVVTELRAEDTVLYEMNPNYRKIPEGKPFFGTAEIKGGGDAEATARSVLEIGEADYAWNLQVAPEILGPMEAAGNGIIAVGFNTSVEHLNLNQTDPDGDPPSDYADGSNPNPYFFENQVLHDALSMAINREEMVAVAYGPAGEPTCNIWPVPGDALSTNNDWCLTHDIEGANALLDENGYLDTDGDGVRETPDGLPLSFEVVTSTNAVRQSEQDLIAVYWEQIGVETSMRNEDAGLFFDGTAASDASIWKFFTDIQLYTNSAVGTDAQSYFQSNLSSEIPESTNSWGGGNLQRLASEEFDAVWQQLSETSLTDPARNELIIQLNDLMVQYAVIPLVNRGSVSAFASTLDGYVDVNGWDSELWNIEDWTRSG